MRLCVAVLLCFCAVPAAAGDFNAYLLGSKSPFYTAYSQSGANYHLNNPHSWTGSDGTYTATASFRYNSSGYGPGLAFATSVSTGAKDGWVGMCGTSNWLRLGLPLPKVMDRFRLYTRANANNNFVEAPKGFTVQGSADGSTWTTIYDSGGAAPPGWQGGWHQPSSWMEIENPRSFKYYQLNVKDCVSGNVGLLGIGMWEIEGYTGGMAKVIKYDPQQSAIVEMNLIME
ncbi:MAG: discoidin domain-containing protein [Rickettsiales bacterium]|jgi:hypothetical protein|nr:discoidin domain-containing protein [Rickettsiales bacterium]